MSLDGFADSVVESCCGSRFAPIEAALRSRGGSPFQILLPLHRPLPLKHPSQDRKRSITPTSPAPTPGVLPPPHILIAPSMPAQAVDPEFADLAALLQRHRLGEGLGGPSFKKFGLTGLKDLEAQALKVQQMGGRMIGFSAAGEIDIIPDVELTSLLRAVSHQREVQTVTVHADLQ